MTTKEALTPYGNLSLAFASFGGVLFGYHTAVISGALIFFIPVFHLTPRQEGILVSIMLLGGLIGALLAGQIANRLGRKKAMITVAILCMIGSIIMATASSYVQLLIGRCVSGLAVGTISVASPLYLAEIAPPHHRGRYVSIFQLCISLGVLFSFVMAYFLSGKERWEALFAIGAILSFLQFLVLLFVPETPAWSLTHGKAERAAVDLARLRKDILWKSEIKDMDRQTRPKYRWSDFLKPHMPYILFVGIVTGLLQQITGINAVMYYAPKILDLAKDVPQSSSFAETVTIGCINSLSTLISLWLLDKKGRRILLLLGTLGMAMSLGLLSYSFFRQDHTFLILIALLGYVFSFSFSLGPVVWVLLSEIFPLKIRSNAIACAVGVNWLGNYCVSLTFPDMIHAWGPGWSFMLYAGISLFAFFFVYCFIPETKGKSLEEIEVLVESGKF